MISCDYNGSIRMPMDDFPVWQKYTVTTVQQGIKPYQYTRIGNHRRLLYFYQIAVSDGFNQWCIHIAELLAVGGSSLFLFHFLRYMMDQFFINCIF